MRYIISNTILETSPLIVFTGTYFFYGIFEAIFGSVICTAISIVIYWKSYKNIPRFMLFSAFFSLIFGLLSLLFNDSQFFVIQQSIYYLVFSIILLIGIFYHHLILKDLFESFFLINDHCWKILSWRWIWFFLLLSTINPIIYYTFTESGWVIFHSLRPVIIAIYGCTHFSLSAKNRLPGSNKWGLRTTPIPSDIS